MTQSFRSGVFAISNVLLAIAVFPRLGLAAPQIQLVTLTQGLQGSPSARQMLASESAQAGGPDFSANAPTALPDAAAAYGNGKLFYALFNIFGDPEAARAYGIQRIRKTVLNFRSASDTRPQRSVEYLVEIFKLRGGSFKRADLHHGTYPLGGFYKRQVIKELEVGTGELPSVATGEAWPFDPATLYKLVQDYTSDHALFDSVRFDHSVSWKISAELGSDGRYELAVPLLGVNLGSGR